MMTQNTKWTRRRALFSGAVLISTPPFFYTRQQQQIAAAHGEELKQEVEEERRRLKQLAAEERERRERELYQQLDGKLKTSIARASQSDADVLRTARYNLALELAQCRERALAEVPAIVDQASRFGECVKMIGLMATDQIKGSSQVAEHTAARVEPIRRILQSMGSTTNSSLHSVCHHINAHTNEISTQFLSNLAEITEGPGSDIRSFNDHLARLSEKLQTQQFGLAIDTSLLSLETFLAFGLRRILFQVLGAYASRAATMVGANVVLSAADGPLPIGEVIALVIDAGFITWSAWSLYRTCKKIKPEIRSALVDAIYKAEADTLDDFDRVADALLERAHEKRETSLAPVLLTNR